MEGNQEKYTKFQEEVPSESTQKTQKGDGMVIAGKPPSGGLLLCGPGKFSVIKAVRLNHRAEFV